MTKKHDRCHYCNRGFASHHESDNSYVCEECGYGGLKGRPETDHDCKCGESTSKDVDYKKCPHCFSEVIQFFADHNVWGCQACSHSWELEPTSNDGAGEADTDGAPEENSSSVGREDTDVECSTGVCEEPRSTNRSVSAPEPAAILPKCTECDELYMDYGMLLLHLEEEHPEEDEKYEGEEPLYAASDIIEIIDRHMELIKKWKDELHGDTDYALAEIRDLKQTFEAELPEFNQ